MKKILLSGMLIASLGMQAQIIGDKIENATIGQLRVLPAAFTSDNKDYFISEEKDYFISEEYYEYYNTVGFQVYNDKLEPIKKIGLNGVPICFQYFDFSLFCDEGYGIEISQTLFNDDDKYEYVRCIYEDTDGGEGFDEEVGFEIVNEDGKVLQSIRYATPMPWPYYEIIKINDKLYWGSRSDYDYHYDEWYEITPGSGTGLKKVQLPAGLSVMPSLAKRHQSITIETDDVSKNREVNIVDASGKSVWRQILPAGQKSIRVNATKLSKGLNVVNVDGEKEKSVKVIVN